MPQAIRSRISVELISICRTATRRAGPIRFDAAGAGPGDDDKPGKSGQSLRFLPCLQFPELVRTDYKEQVVLRVV